MCLTLYSGIVGDDSDHVHCFSRWEDARYYAEILESNYTKGSVAAEPAGASANDGSTMDATSPLNKTMDGGFSPASNSRSPPGGAADSPEVASAPMGKVAQTLYQKQAAVAEADGDLRAAGEMYVQLGKLRKAVEIFCKIAALDSLIQTVLL